MFDWSHEFENKLHDMSSAKRWQNLQHGFLLRFCERNHVLDVQTDRLYWQGYELLWEFEQLFERS